jgi:hypothetical protein
VRARSLPPKALFQAPPLISTPNAISQWDLTADGKRFLFEALTAKSAQAPFTVVLNWQAALKKWRQGRNSNRTKFSQLLARGMGEIYRARDPKLGRDLAIQVPPEAFARDAERMARFQREAKVLASLDHPNIATIHGWKIPTACTHP